MEKLLIMDGGNYDESWPEILRVAVRGIISLEGKMIFVEDSHGVLKLPGGGQDPGEDDLTTLAREVLEETGYRVIPGTERELGCIEEKRRDMREDKIWHQINRIYYCEVYGEQGETAYSENEERLGMHLRMCSLEEAIAINESRLEKEGRHAWNQREYKTLLLIKERLRAQDQGSPASSS